MPYLKIFLNEFIFKDSLIVFPILILALLLIFLKNGYDPQVKKRVLAYSLLSAGIFILFFYICAWIFDSG